ncbi:MAG TPA: M4 family metallopeptidase, partial [Bacteroidales bacterium]|nr:M4 family metallopeptidase [Bacteroidales bacterium]
MRTILPVVFAVLFTLNVNGQVTNFKQPVKKPAGTVNHNLNYETIDGRNALKSASSGIPRSLKSISFTLPDNEPIVVRKGNTPIYIEQKVTPLNSASAVTNEDRLFRFLEENKALTGINNPRESFKIKNIHTDDLGISHIWTIQQYKGIEVYGSESVFHFDSQKERFTGSFFKSSVELDINPKVQYTQALELVKKDLSKITVYRELTSKEKKFLKYDAAECSLILFDKSGGNYSLAWMISVRPNFIEEWQYTIDASDGSIIRKFNNTKSDGPTTGSAPDLNNISRTFDVYLEAGTYYLLNISMPMFNSATEEGMIMTLNANNTSTSNLDYSMITSTNNAWSGMSSAVSAHYNAFLAYEYFRTKFNRNSINAQGGNIISFINVTENDGSSMENAFWNGQAVFYGNGGSHFKSLSGAIDVSAHELGHGVVSNSANLEYQGQSGAINETYADIFGSMVDRDDWLIGEDVVKTTYYPTGALRDMSDPHNGGTQSNIYWQPAHVSEMYLGSQDNGGVHINSGIGNRAYYLFATAVTKDKAERVFYRALTEYLTKTSQFIDFRIAVVQAAKDLYGASSTEAVKAGEAFDVVGIYPDEPEVEEPDNYDTNPGQQ